MKLARLILIKDALYNVVFKRQIAPVTKNKRVTVGLCDPEKYILYIKTGQDPMDRLIAWIHEVGHGLEEEWGFEIPHHILDDKLDRAIAHLLIDNGWIVLPKK